MELPSCVEDYEPELVLTITDRRKLIKGLADGGTKSIGKFIDDHENDSRSGIAKLIKRLRTHLEHQMARTRAQIENKYKKKESHLKSESSELYEPFSVSDPNTSQGEISQHARSYADREIDTKLLDILTHDDVLNLVINITEEPDDAKLSWWSKFKNAFYNFFIYLINLFQRFRKWLKNKFSKREEIPSTKKPQRANILLKFSSGGKLWENIDHNLDNALATSPDFRRAIERDLEGATKKIPSQKRTTWQRHFNREKYEEQVRRVVNNRIKRAIKREQRKLANDFKKKQRRVKKLQKDKAHQELHERELAAKRKQVEKQRATELDKLKHQYRNQVQRSVRSALESELEDAGYVQKDLKNEMKITTRLIDRFAELVLSDEIAKLPSKYSYSSGTIGLPHGVYEKKKLRTSAESSRMDIVASMVNARLAHPQQKHIFDSDIITHIDIRSTVNHVVLIFDKSGSMEENDRIKAAKKAVLALYKAVKHRNQRNIVDFIAFDSTVQVMDILQAWRCSPSGFTNTGEALNTAYSLLKDSKADRKMIYLITDGLPEAYTDAETGEPRAGNLEKSLSNAVNEAKKLRKIAQLKLTLILLEPEEEIYTEAASTIAKAAAGEVIVTDPNELATEMLMDYIEV